MSDSSQLDPQNSSMNKISTQHSLKPPNLAKYDFNPTRVGELLKEYGAMLPSKDVYCTPDPKVIQFLKMLNDYLQQCHRELNYYEAKRSKQKIQLLSQIEYARQMRRMEESQNQELIYVEQIQRKQFAEFTEAWDSYMSEYEANAYQSIDRLRQD